MNLRSNNFFIPVLFSFRYLCEGLLPNSFSVGVRRPHFQFRSSSGFSVDLESISKMRASEIKAELDLRGISYQNIFEKEDLVRLLRDARSTGRADPSIMNQFNRDVLELKVDDELKRMMENVDEEAIKDIAAKDGSVPGGLTPEMIQKFMSNPELMGMLQNPKMQEVMKSVMRDGPAGMSKFINDREAMEMLKKLESIISS